MPSLTQRDMNISALTIYGEARSEPYAGQVAVAWVIRNRAEFATKYLQEHGKDYSQFGDGSPASACLARMQFSCWNEGDPNRAKMLQFLWQGDTDRAIMTAAGHVNPAVSEAMDAVEDAFGGDAADDPTGGATHYYATSIDKPAWAKGLKPTIVIGAHAFYAGVDHLDNPDMDWTKPPDPPPDPTSIASTTEPPAAPAASSLPVSPSPYAPQPVEHVESVTPFWRWVVTSFLSGLRGLFT